MAIMIVDRNYSTRNHATGNNFLLANSGQIVTETIDIVVDFDFQSTVNELIVIIDNYSIKLLGGQTWGQKGFYIGCSIALTGSINNGTGGTTSYSSFATTITDISTNGDIMTISSDLDPLSSGYVVGSVMPQSAGSASNTPLTIVNSTVSQPESIELFHNLILNSASSGKNSLFDNEVNKFEAEAVNSMIVNDVINFVQQGDKSGGSYISATLKRLADVSSKKSYQMALRYANPYNFEDSDFDEPSWFEQTECVKPFYQINCLPQDNNPNAGLTVTYSGQLANTGWLDESYNQGVNEFTVKTLSLTNTAGDALEEIDYNQSTNVSILITHQSLDFLENAEVEFYLIPDVEDIKNQPERNCDYIHLSNFHVDSVPTVSEDYFGINGQAMVPSNETLNVATPNQILITYTLTPNTDFTTYIESLSEEQRRYRLVATVESTGGDENDNNAVTLTVKEGLLTKEPVDGGVYPDVTFQGFFNHKQNLNGVSEIVYNGCAEDDVLYRSTFNLDKSFDWSSLTLNIQVVRDSDGQYFDLFERVISFQNYVVDNDGKININYLETIQQLLDGDDRNKIEVNLTGNETGSDYEVQLIWSILVSWRYWIEQNNALVDFFDATLPNDGLNNEWMRYLRLAGYTLRLRCTLIDSDDVAYYWGSTINLQDYDDSADFTTDIEYYDSDGVLQTSLLAGQEMTVRAVHTLLSGSWNQSDIWGWISCRPYESAPNKRISTVWDWTSQDLPLKPLSGETVAKLSFPSASIAWVECLVDTSMLNVEQATFIARLETPKDPDCVSPVDYLFNYVVASSDSESDYWKTLENVLQTGLNTSEANVCCPTCEMEDLATTKHYYLWAFGTDADIDSLIATIDTTATPICCRDEYGVSAVCEATFDTEWDNLMLAVSGDTAALTALVPSQINTYSGATLAAISAKIQAITSDTAIRYLLIEKLLTNGFKVTCSITGEVKSISAL